VLIGSLVFMSGHKVARISCWSDAAMILLLATSFSFNIGLNNYSLSMLDLSVNLMVRSMAPLLTHSMELGLQRFHGALTRATIIEEMCLLLTGCACAVIVASCKHSSLAHPEDGHRFYFGLFVCVSSLFAAAVELLLVHRIRAKMQFSPFDMVLYMALPVCAILLVPIVFAKHHVAWNGHEPTTDFRVLTEAASANSGVIILCMMSGVLAAVYNVIMYKVTCDLSPTFTTMASNFNKVASIAIAMIFNMESLPPGLHGMIFPVAVMGNAASLAGFGILKQRK